LSGTLAAVVSSVIEKTQEATLQQPFEFVDNNNKTVLSYIDNIFSCEGGFFSTNQITVRETPGVGWYIALTIILAFVFVLIIDSYWPMLFKIYEAIEKVYTEVKLSITKREEKLKEEAMTDGLNKMAGIMNGEVYIIPNREKEKKEKEKEKEPEKEKHILLKIWVAACILASFIAALVLSTVITTYIQNLLAFEKDYCYQLQKVTYEDVVMSNSSFRKLSNADTNCSLSELGVIKYLACKKAEKNTVEGQRLTTKMQIISVISDEETGEVSTTISLP
jgi:hypothetical protein